MLRSLNKNKIKSKATIESTERIQIAMDIISDSKYVTYSTSRESSC